MTKIHQLKILPKYFQSVLSGEKTFEVRKDDRNFQLGDIVVLDEFDDISCSFTGNYVGVRITYILRDSEFCKSGYCIFSFKRISEIQKEKRRVY